MGEIVCGPPGIGGVLVPTCNCAVCAKDDLWPRGGCLLLELFALSKAHPSHEADLLFVPRLYAEGGGGVGEV
jgi:hypothetical protein